MIAFHRAGWWSKLLVGHLVGQVLDDCRAFGKKGAVVELQRRHIAFRVNGQIVGSGSCLLCLQINAFDIEREPAFAQDNMWRE